MIQNCLRHIHSAIVAMRRRLRDDSGNAIVELAVAFSVLAAPLMLGVSEVSFMVYDSIEVSNAANAGAQYGMISSTLANDTAGIQRAARAEASDLGSNLTVTPTIYYACSSALSGTHYSSTTAAAAACPANAANHYLEFVQVSTSATIVPPVKIPGMSGAWNLQGLSVMEVQE